MNRLTNDSESAAAPAVETATAVLEETVTAAEKPAATADKPRRPDPRKRPTIVAKPKSKKVSGAVMKIIRRTHLYTGLLLLPWVLIFGVSGFLFNHEDLFRPAPVETVTNIAPADLQKDLGFAAVDGSLIASQVVEQLNAQAGEGDAKFKLVSSGNVRGLLTLSANGEVDGASVRHTYTMNLNSGKAWVSTTPVAQQERPQTTTPPFNGKQVQVAALPVEGLNTKIDDLTYELGIDSDGNWATRGRGGGPEVRFVMQDDAGRDWHVTYNVMRGTLGGRAADEKPAMDFAQTMSRLHKLHHYPTEFGMRWIWMLAADATALTMVFWGISGLIMWWQLKPTRTIGIAAVSVMAVVGFVIVFGVLDDLTFTGGGGRGGFGGAGGPGGGARPAVQPQQQQPQQPAAPGPQAQSGNELTLLAE